MLMMALSSPPVHLRARLGMVVVAALLFTLGGCGASGGASTGTTPVTAYGSVKPRGFVYTGDNTGELRNVAWETWGRGIARGTGESWTNDCRPDCATGTWRDGGPIRFEVRNISGNRYTTFRITSPVPAGMATQYPVSGG
jgi:hypothetical protein